MSSHTKSMLDRIQGLHERMREGSRRANRTRLPKWLRESLSQAEEIAEGLELHIRQIHEADELERPRTVWDPPATCPHRIRCGLPATDEGGA